MLKIEYSKNEKYLQEKILMLKGKNEDLEYKFETCKALERIKYNNLREKYEEMKILFELCKESKQELKDKLFEVKESYQSNIYLKIEKIKRLEKEIEKIKRLEKEIKKLKKEQENDNI